MKKTHLALTALMIGIMTVTGTSFAEAGLRVGDVKIVIETSDKHKTPGQDTHQPPEPPAKPRPDRHAGHGELKPDPQHGHDKPAPKPSDSHGPSSDGHHKPAPHEKQEHGHDKPAPDPSDSHGPSSDGHHKPAPHEKQEHGHDAPPPRPKS
ncbi:MAG: hypothetical protein K5841_02415 [Fretibacterium sp.]|nr:hypothetical protein [Fretibacterium sp.]